MVGRLRSGKGDEKVNWILGILEARPPHSPFLFYFPVKFSFPAAIINMDLSCVLFEIHNVESRFPNHADFGTGQVTGHRRNHHLYGKG
jgi:hypothetical protein